ncbi:MAG TPA: PfkB family carbohydrate kinase [Acidimicrobiia bacterium]|nr:PfkB family carbohydrate kinase [Acidimicrobiia bacterium]
MASETPTVCVFAPSVLVTVTVETGNDEFDEMHFHLGGQGYWIARMIRELGERPVLVAPVGGEAGQVVRGLVRSSGIDFAPVTIEGASPSYIHDRRDGERTQVASSRSPELNRHEIDDLFAKTLHHALGAGLCVLTGKRAEDTLPVDFYRRLGSDLQATQIRSVGDLHGDELTEFLEGGPIDILKVSDEDLASDGLLDSGSEDDSQAWAAIAELQSSGTRAAVVSRGSGALASFKDARMRAAAPEFEVVDSSGAGDSMTAALAVSLVRGLDPEESLRLACAAGAANVLRHGLASSPAELIGRLAPLIDVTRIDE